MPEITRVIFVYAATLITFVALDVTWLMLVAIGQFQSQLGAILRPEPSLIAAVILYVIIAGGLVALAVRPALKGRSLITAGMHGAVLGLTAYATFDLTNLAIINGWTIGLALLDMAWGTAVSSIAAVAGYFAGASVMGGTPDDKAAAHQR